MNAEAWAGAAPVAGLEHRDSNGALLAQGDTVVLIKDLPVKGAGFTAKRGTAVRGIRLVHDNADQIEGKVNGQTIDVMVDTGATNIGLSRRDAEAAGIDPGALAYIGSANTANGTVSTARVRLDSLALGDVVDAGISAYVTSGAMMDSLLGMDYLRRYRIEIDGAKMILSR